MPALAWFAIVVFVLTITPGPGVLYVMARAVSQGRRAGFASAFGIESGEVVWIVAAAAGVAALLAASAGALTALRLAGAAYLVYLGIQRWRHAEKVELPRAAPLARLYAHGVITQLLNPKVALFAVALLPQFIDPLRPIAPQVAVLGAVYIGIAVAVDTAYVLASAAIARRLLGSRVAQRRTAQASAATYVALGVATAVSGARAQAGHNNQPPSIFGARQQGWNNPGGLTFPLPDAHVDRFPPPAHPTPGDRLRTLRQLLL